MRVKKLKKQKENTRKDLEELFRQIIEWQGIMLNNYAKKVEELSVYKTVCEAQFGGNK